jgi:[acyl-carrier-protein] S-malonyltransferase
MEPAASELRTEIERVELLPPTTRFYSTVDAQVHDDPGEIAALLVQSITRPVRFAQAMSAMREEGVDEFVEVGPGRALRGLVRQNLSGVTVVSVGSDTDADEYIGSTVGAAK